MEKNIQEYFGQTIMPLLRSRHSDILSEASIMILGSVGLHIEDEFSDMEAVLYLPDRILKQNGGAANRTGGMPGKDKPVEAGGHGKRFYYLRASFILDAGLSGGKNVIQRRRYPVGEIIL